MGYGQIKGEIEVATKGRVSASLPSTVDGSAGEATGGRRADGSGEKELMNVVWSCVLLNN